MARPKNRPVQDALLHPIDGRRLPDSVSVDEVFREAGGQELLRLMEELLEPVIPFSEFVERTADITLEPWQVHLTNRLERLADETGQRILVHKPPQFGGSTIISERWPAYQLGRNPMRTFREVTHNQDHSEDFSDTVQEIIRSKEYQDIFAATMLPKQTNAREWSTTVRGERRSKQSQPSYMAIGMGGSFVGTGGDDFLVDDPYGNDKDAYSVPYNTDVRNWHRRMLLRRLRPESNLVVMFHRFQPEDYAGWLESDPSTTGNDKPWEIIRYASLADEVDARTGLDFLGRKLDESLAPDRFPAEYLKAIRNGDPQTFYGLYQGLPQNPEGEAIMREWFLIQGDENRETKDGRFIPAFDPAKILGGVLYFDIGASERGDETVGTLDAAMQGGYYSWLWQFVGRWAPAERDDQMVSIGRRLQRKLNFVAQLEEGIGLGRETVDRIAKKMRAAGINTQVVRSKGSKWERATNRQDSFRSSAQAGKIHLYEGNWLADLGLTDGKIKWIEPYLQEVTALRVKQNGLLVGKDNKFDSGTGAHNGVLKLSKPQVSLGDLQAFARRFG